MSKNLLPAGPTKRKSRKTYHAFYLGGHKTHTSLLAKLRQDFRITESALVKNYIATLITFVRERAKNKEESRPRKTQAPARKPMLGLMVEGGVSLIVM